MRIVHAHPQREGRPSVAGHKESNEQSARKVWIDWRSIAASAVALALAFAIVYIVWLVLRPLAVLMMSIVLAETLEPLVGRLQNRLRRSFAILVVYFGIVVVIALMVLAMLPSFLSDVGALTEEAPQFRDDVTNWINDQGVSTDQLTSVIQGQASGGGLFASIPIMIFTGFTELFLAVFLSIYWLIAKPGARSLLLSMVPPSKRDRAGEVAEAVGSTVGGYLRGVIITGAILAVFTYIGLMIIGVDYAIPLAILVFFGEFVPILGPLLTAIPALGIAAFDGLTQVLLVAGLYVIVQLLENNVVYPQVMKRATSIPPFLVIFAILAGGSAGGLIGALVAIPLAGAIRVLILELAVPEIQHRMGNDEPPK